MNLTYLIGQPGAGKTTVLAALTEGESADLRSKPFAHMSYPNGAIQLGRTREDFGGTDALAMSVQPKVLAWLAHDRPTAVFGEGDRLGNGKFFRAVDALGYGLTVVLLRTPDEVAAGRRADRGSKQNETWLLGRRSKVENLRPWVTHIADGTRPVEEIVAGLKLLPVFNLF